LLVGQIEMPKRLTRLRSISACQAQPPLHRQIILASSRCRSHPARLLAQIPA
jgi:hypothetical protein